MEYGIRTRGLGAGGGGGGGGGPASWLETAAAYGHPLAPFQFPSGAALLLNSLHSLQQSGANAMELVWKPDKHKPPDDEEEEEEPEEEEDEEEEERHDNSPVDEVAAEGLVVKAEDEEDDEEEKPDGVENDGSVESWKETPMPILSGWMLNAYASMLGRLTAATATSVFEPAESSNLTSDSESESNQSSDMQSRESSPSRPTYQICDGTTSNPKSRSRKKCQRRTSDAKTKSSKKEDPGTADSSPSNSQGNKRSSALQRVRYRYEREEYRCSLCSYACTIEKAFQRHLRAHARGTANESRVSCAVCGADRSSEVDLSKHMRRHRDNRYFCCDICIFRTVQLKKLIQHRRMHTGEKPHLCPHCAYRSARRDNLRSHVRRVHKKENLYCDTFSPRGMFIAPKLQPAASLDEEEELPTSASPSPTPPPPIENAEPRRQRDEEATVEESSEMA